MPQQTVNPVLVTDTVGRRSSAAEMSPLEEDGVVSPDESRLRGRLKNSESLYESKSVFGHLSSQQSAELSDLRNNYLCLFNDVPTRTHLLEHDIDVDDVQPVGQRFTGYLRRILS